MANKVVVFCVVAAVLGIISAATGFAAEFTKVKASEVHHIDTVLDTCVYPSSPAIALGIISAVFTIITRIYIMVSFGGNNCRIDPNSTPISKLLLVLSWVASVLAVLLLVIAASLSNRKSGHVNSHDGSFTCYVVKSGIFAAGAIFALLSAVFGIAAYLSFSSVAHETTTKPTIGLENHPGPFPPQQFPLQQSPLMQGVQGLKNGLIVS